VVLKVGLAHVGEFGGIENTFAIKGELPKALAAGSKLLLNADDSYVSRMAEETLAEVHWFGTDSSSEVWADSISLTLAGTIFNLHAGDFETPVKLNILGEHQVMNALAAIGVAKMLELDLASAVAALERMILAERWRMQVLEGINGSVVINDAYNANPDSTLAAIDTFRLAFARGGGGTRRVLILGDMLELGHDAPDLHREVGEAIAKAGCFDLVVLVGALSRNAASPLAAAASSVRVECHPDAGPVHAATIAAGGYAGSR
jgi:UDP-N-acetylmuramoyl-tripeptide--D-alanyl-D-alanine ligase